MTSKLSEYQQKVAAQNIIDRLALKQDLSNLKTKIDEIFQDASIEVAESTSRTELEELISGIKNGTATNNKISRFLELTAKLGID